MKPPLNFRHIRAFLAVVEKGGITKAAESLYRAQSAITRSIKSLESELGVPLFAFIPRQTRGRRAQKCKRENAADP